MVHESYTWFSSQGVIPLEININVGQTIDKNKLKTLLLKYLMVMKPGMLQPSLLKT